MLGAQTRTFHLTEQHIEFCRNCRECTQQPGVERGPCKQQDDLEAMLKEIEAADAVVLASPVNYYNVTAIFRRFLERLLGYRLLAMGTEWAQLRNKRQPRKAVLVAAAGMPGFLIPLTTGAARALRLAARMLGAKPVGKLWVGLAAGKARPALSARTLERARRLGMKLGVARRANLLCDQAAGDGVQDAVEEVDGLGTGVAAADFEGLVDDDGKGRALEAKQLGYGHAQQIAIDGGHAFQAPVFGVGDDERVDLFLAVLGDAEEVFGEAADFGLHGIAGLPEGSANLSGVWRPMSA